MNIKYIEKKYEDVKIEHCNENKCDIKIDTGKRFVILKGKRLDNKPDSKKICNCIIFQEGNKIILIEMKRSSLQASKICEQFKNCIPRIKSS